MNDRIKKAIEVALSPYKTGDTLIVAVSGGADSMVLLHAAQAFAIEIGIRLHVAHMDHMLRAESADDARFVQQQAEILGLPFTLSRQDVSVFAKQKKLSIEDAGRQARYVFFKELLRAQNARAMLLAHHMDDQAETVLLHLLRGSGTAGLTGMKVRTGKIVRPFLIVRREEIDQYAKAQGIAHIEDASNKENIYVRNTIRNKILPLIETNVNINAVESLCRAAEILGAENEFFRQAAEDCLRAIGTENGVDARKLCACPRALSRRAVRILCERSGLQQDLSFAHVESVLKLCERAQGNGYIDLPRGFRAALIYGMLSIERTKRQMQDRADWAVDFNRADITELPNGCKLTAKLIDQADARFGSKTDSTQYFDADSWPDAVQVRMRRPGDVMRPLGAPGHKKFKDCLIDHKIPPQFRDMILLCNGNNVLWAVGFCISHDVRIMPDTQRIICIEHRTGAH